MWEGVARTFVGGLTGAWLLVFAVFLKLMKKKYRGTFISLQTGNAWAKSSFLDGKTDQVRMTVHGFNLRQWMSIREDVKQYTLESWERWEEEKPAWFNDAFVASVDDDMIPKAVLREIEATQDGSRRRSFLGRALGGGSSVTPVLDEADNL